MVIDQEWQNDVVWITLNTIKTTHYSIFWVTHSGSIGTYHIIMLRRITGQVHYKHTYVRIHAFDFWLQGRITQLWLTHSFEFCNKTSYYNMRVYYNRNEAFPHQTCIYDPCHTYNYQSVWIYLLGTNCFSFLNSNLSVWLNTCAKPA